MIPLLSDCRMAELIEAEGEVQLVPRIGQGNREHKRCNSAPLGTSRKVPFNSTSSRLPSQVGLQRSEALICVPESFRAERRSFLGKPVVHSPGGRKLDPKDYVEKPINGEVAFFCKPPFLYSEPQVSPLHKFKTSLIMDDSIKHVPPRRTEDLHSSLEERQTLATAVRFDVDFSEERINLTRPSMPAKLSRKDMTAKSRVRLTPNALKENACHGLQRSNSAAHELKDGDESKWLSNFTYYSFKDVEEWKMPMRPKYARPKSKRPLDGLHGRMSPGLCHPSLESALSTSEL